jgi:metal transporter CNNM
VDETDIYVDVQQKIKVVRGPNKRAAGKALAPLIQGSPVLRFTCS